MSFIKCTIPSESLIDSTHNRSFKNAWSTELISRDVSNFERDASMAVESDVIWDRDPEAILSGRSFGDGPSLSFSCSYQSFVNKIVDTTNRSCSGNVFTLA